MMNQLEEHPCDWYSCDWRKSLWKSICDLIEAHNQLLIHADEHWLDCKDETASILEYAKSLCPIDCEVVIDEYGYFWIVARQGGEPYLQMPLVMGEWVFNTRSKHYMFHESEESFVRRNSSSASVGPHC